MEKTEIKKVGSSAAIYLNQGALKVYGLQIGSHIKIDYAFPNIIVSKDDEND